MKTLKRIAIFASGAGSNAEKLIQHFNISSPHREPRGATIRLIVCNKPDAGVLNIARKYGVPALLVEREKFFRGGGYLSELKKANIDFIVLAGFVWKLPQVLVDAYQRKIVNIHPALLPKYGGLGMYGSNVHKAVIEAGEKKSGITIHYVDEQYDHGTIIFQQECAVQEDDTPETLAEKIHSMEHKYYPEVVEKLLNDSQQN